MSPAAPASWRPRSLVRRTKDRVASLRSPEVTVLVDVNEDNEEFLDECVASLAAQSHPRCDVVLLRASTAGAEEVRGAAIREARGDYLMFADAGDTLPAPAVASLVGSLEASGSDLVVGGAARSGARLDLTSAPGVLPGVEAGDLMFRRSLLTEPDLLVSAVTDREAGAPWRFPVQALLRATTFDMVAETVRDRLGRGTGMVFGAVPARAGNTAGWARSQLAVLAELEGRGLAQARELWLEWSLGVDAPLYLDDAVHCSPEQWSALAGTIEALMDAAGPALQARVPVEQRVKSWLAANRPRAQVEAFSARRWLEEGQFPTEVHRGRVYARFFEPPDERRVGGSELLPDPDLPREVLELSPAETGLRVNLRRLTWADRTHVDLEVLAVLATVGSDDRDGFATLTLDDGHGHSHELATERRSDAGANLVSRARFHDHARGVFAARLDVRELLAEATGPAEWTVGVRLTTSGVTRAAPVSDYELRGSVKAFGPREVAGSVVSAERRDRRGLVLVAVPSAQSPRPTRGEPSTDGPGELHDVSLDGGVLVLRGREAVAGSGTSIELRGPRATISVPLGNAVGEFEVRLPLVHDPWGFGETPLPPGGYRAVLVAGERGGRLRMSQELADRTPEWQTSSTYRLRLLRALDGTVLVNLAAPTADDELGPFAQHRLQRWHVDGDHEVDASVVYLQSYTGQSATDSPRAIHDALRRMRPDLTLRWGVADSSATAPDGADPVLVRSREWYRLLSVAGSIVTNIELDRWFAKRPGQRVLQTFHGYPSKTMGLASWEAKNFGPLRIEELLRRTSRVWDLLLTPTPEMDVHYRHQYLYDGEIFNAGYPRDDALVGPGLAELRETSRLRLGIAADQRAVLYAPTWRDDLATNFRAASMVTSFDVEEAARALGDEYVLLLRGHRFHRRRPQTGGSTLLDVTDYPEVNDLIAASDAAVFDYTSMRFDFALTGRPMVFLVPDLARYDGRVRGFLFDFASSAPGPLLNTTDQVVAQLRDLERVRQQHESDYARFNATFNRLQDGRSAERTVAAFFGPVPQPRG